MIYTLFEIPFGRDFRDLPRNEARQFFDRFVAQIPTRIRMLEAEVRRTRGFESWNADAGDPSIAALSLWLAILARSRKLTAEELAYLKESVTGPLRSIVAQLYPLDLTPETYSYCIDAAMYVGETIRQRHPEVAWRLGPEPKRGQFYNRPVLMTQDKLFIEDPIDWVKSMVYHFVADGRTLDLPRFVADLENRIRKRR